MGYYVRAFCTSSNVPDLASVQTWLRAHRSSAVLDEPNHAVEMAKRGASRPPVLDLKTSEWEHVAITYRAGKLPILVECNCDDGTGECLMRQEVAEFVALVERCGRSDVVHRVLKQLAATKFIVASQLPMSDIEADGYNANGYFLMFFVKHCGGMIQADGEGFYAGKKLILPLD